MVKDSCWVKWRGGGCVDLPQIRRAIPMKAWGWPLGLASQSLSAVAKLTVDLFLPVSVIAPARTKPANIVRHAEHRKVIDSLCWLGLQLECCIAEHCSAGFGTYRNSAIIYLLLCLFIDSVSRSLHSSGMLRSVGWYLGTEVSDQPVGSIFRGKQFKRSASDAVSRAE